MIFKKLKKICIVKAVLKIFNTKKLIKIKTNISNSPIKECFIQKYKNMKYLVTYVLKNFLLTKSNYNSYNKKL